MPEGIEERLRKRADSSGWLSYADFTEVALYDPDFGYYRRSAKRVGRTNDADFYTAESLGPVFAKLVMAALRKLWPEAETAAFVEIGAEPGASPLAEANWPGGYRAIDLDDALRVPSKAVVFANEWLDAQPFHRFAFRGGHWREIGVELDSGAWREVEREPSTEAANTFVAELPRDSEEGFLVDISLAAEEKLRELLTPEWGGLLLLFDYGKTSAEFLASFPRGTATAYRQHRASRDLLAAPGEQDLTCHVWWDRLARIARAHGFREPSLERQEAFFVHHAELAIREIVEQAPATFDRERQTLMELLHPQHLGQKFQALWARR